MRLVSVILLPTTGVLSAKTWRDGGGNVIEAELVECSAMGEAVTSLKGEKKSHLALARLSDENRDLRATFSEVVGGE